ncbi:MAG: ribonuclease T2 [Sinobacteraceae bacterium]|nr:ribonuclease T2 [Nevskiaceae bacterium]
MSSRIRLATLLFACLAGLAQARHHHSGAQSAAEAGQFDYYLLSLSWAPTYCLTHADDGAECAGKGYGFVLHGLWPQYDGGGYPQNCPTGFELSAAARAKGRTIYPSERLMQHEWQEHGTCSGLAALAYFEAADRAMAVMKIPAALESPPAEQSLTADQIARLFESANPGMPEGALTLACNRDSFSEIRVCLTKDLLIRACGRRVRSSCPAVSLQIPASR